MSDRARFRVRFGDVDPAGIVYYPHLVHYTHIALEDFLEARGIDYPQLIAAAGVGLPTVHLEMDFLAPLRFGDRVEVETSVERLGRTSISWRHELYRRDGDEVAATPAAVARIVTVCVKLDGMAKREIPETLRRALEVDAERAEADG